MDTLRSKTSVVEQSNKQPIDLKSLLKRMNTVCPLLSPVTCIFQPYFLKAKNVYLRGFILRFMALFNSCS